MDNTRLTTLEISIRKKTNRAAPTKVDTRLLVCPKSASSPVAQPAASRPEEDVKSLSKQMVISP
jgi:hypothetical protein